MSREDIYRQAIQGGEEGNKKGGRLWREGGGCISPEDISYLRGEGGGGAGGAEGGASWASLVAAAKTSSDDSTSQALLFRLGSQKELAGGVVSLLPM